MRVLSRRAQIFSAQIRVGTEFRGLRYLTHYHPYVLCTLNLGLYFAFYLVVFIVLWLAMEGRLRGTI